MLLLNGIFGHAEVSVTKKDGVVVAAHTQEEIAVDGVLSETVWSRKADISGYFQIFDPQSDKPLPQKTDVWFAYDYDNIYFAFYCYDTEPEKIKTTVCKRDEIPGDDWAGLVIDTVGSRQFGYTFLVNPNGIQTDMIMTSDGNTNDSPDWVWESAGKVTEDGYILEFKVPLRNFKFKSGENVDMNVFIARYLSREAVTSSWPAMPAGTSPLAQMGTVRFGKLNNQLKLELLPSVTYGSIWDRKNPDEWSSPDDKFDFGISGKYGITSSITAELTYNPDFSQVESDSFQILVNQRYPIFYSEKRPFFMETSNRFKLGGTGNGDYNMYYPVHTRNIVDPEWGFKLNGEAGKFSFDFLAAGDEYPGRAWEDDINPFEGKNALFAVGRLKYVLWGDSYIGAIFTSRSFGGGYNNVIGGDFLLRANAHIFKGHYLYSSSKDDDGIEKSDGSAWMVEYFLDTKPVSAEIYWEHLDEEFRMDTAFISRIAMDKVTGYLGGNIYPDGEKFGWIKKINPYFYGYYIKDIETDENEYFYLLGLRIYTSRQGFLRTDYMAFDEFWKNQRLKGGYYRVRGEIQATNWLRLYSHIYFGDKAYYDADVPYVGNRTNFNFEVSLQPTGNLYQNFDYTYEVFKNNETDDTVYDYNIFRSITKYQLDEHFFLRAIIQYDSYSEVVLSDLLASFTLIPGTVLHLGYGSLHQKVGWQNNKWESGIDFAKYYQTSQSIFFKASYLIQF